MNPRNDPPTDDEIDRLLASRYRDTTPEFEARWREVVRGLRQEPSAQRHWWRWPALWTGLAAAGAAAVALLVLRPVPAPPAAAFSPAFAELFEMNEVLDRALPLVDAENRDALLHLPVNPPPST